MSEFRDKNHKGVDVYGCGRQISDVPRMRILNGSRPFCVAIFIFTDKINADETFTVKDSENL